MASKLTKSSSDNTLIALQDVLAASVLSGGFSDVIFYIPSRRSASGKTVKTGVLFANSEVLKAASVYFFSLLDGGFSESRGIGRNDKSSQAHPALLDMYDYDDDSDLEDDEVIEKECSIDVKEVSGLFEFADERILTCSRLLYHEAITLQMPKIKKTEYFFAPLTSQGARETLGKVSASRSPYKCSPKSMYRLADKLDLPTLKQKAAMDIQSKLRADNILQELFSKFTSRYPDILEAETTFFCNNYLTPQTMPAIEQKLDEIVENHGSML
ncbi:hypothetical protein A0H81_08953, partial [Grifola frondosa]